MQRYLIIFDFEGIKSAAFTDWFNTDNHWNSNYIAVVDRAKSVVMFDGMNWEKIEDDHL